MMAGAWCCGRPQADDFLGQLELDFAQLEGAGSSAEPRWLPLYQPGRGGKHKPAGQLSAAVWFGEAPAGGEPGGGGLSSLCYPPGVPKRVPLVLHAGGHSLYEEPLMVGGACWRLPALLLSGLPPSLAAGFPPSLAAGAVAWPGSMLSSRYGTVRSCRPQCSAVRPACPLPPRCAWR